MLNRIKNWWYWRNIHKAQKQDSEKYFKVYYDVDGKLAEKIPWLDKEVIKEWLDRAKTEKVVISRDDIEEDLEIGDAMMQVYAYINNLRPDQLRYGCYPAWQDMIECEEELNFERNIYFKKI